MSVIKASTNEDFFFFHEMLSKIYYNWNKVEVLWFSSANLSSLSVSETWALCSNQNK